MLVIRLLLVNLLIEFLTLSTCLISGRHAWALIKIELMRAFVIISSNLDKSKYVDNDN